ncbi:MAG: ABC transporter substrate-binding protein, partial [Planctomycetota bacterium]
LRYLTLDELSETVMVLPATFERQDYAFALPLESPLRKSMNQALLERLSGEEWERMRREYLGSAR